MLLVGSTATAAPFDQVDDFEDGTTMGWTGGKSGAPQNVANGGPSGAGDAYLQIIAAGFHLGTYNVLQWTGDYKNAGVSAVELDLNHISPSGDNVQMRLLVFGPGGAFASRDRTPVLMGNQWAHYRFGLSTNNLVYVTGGTGVLDDTLQAVTKVLIRNDSAVPTLPGTHPPHITATLGIDNIRAVRSSDVNWPRIGATDTLSGLTRPVYVTHAADGRGRLFVVEQPGRIRVVRDGALLPTPFLDITARVAGGTTGGDERGLLGLAFPPGSGAKSHFYVYYYASAANQTVLSRFSVGTNDVDVADAASEQIVLTIAQPQQNHNGGQIAFGADGYLYLAPGDGGGGDDDDAGHGTIGNGQSTLTLLGKVLRIDTETPPLTNSYAIPAGNPFVGNAGALDEIWAYGLRNPYRFSFDRETGDLYIGDVGQNSVEEIDFEAVASIGGRNYGWRRYEGTSCTGIQGDSCNTNGLTFPVWEYGHTEGRQAVTGGYVHRGAPGWSFLHGTYLYADYSTGEIWGLKRKGTNWFNRLLHRSGFSISGFGEDEDGEMYVCDIFGGSIRRLVEMPADSDGDLMPDAYEVTHGFAVNDASDADDDDDGDKLSNLDELTAGTDPTNVLSRLRLTEVSMPATNQTLLRWSSVNRRSYGVSRSTRLAGAFAPMVTNLPATPPVNVFTTSTATARSAFYRIGVREE